MVLMDYPYQDGMKKWYPYHDLGEGDGRDLPSVPTPKNTIPGTARNQRIIIEKSVARMVHHPKKIEFPARAYQAFP
jgi:hypothetical protein